MTEKKRTYYGDALALRIYGGKEGRKTGGLKFESEEAERFADCLLKASRQKKVVDVTAYKSPRKNGKHQVTVTAID